ncbi:hypothetical protein [Myceligenerans xiligouense]|uniref:Uncharacterized protein n=1 Tax=Myceligenerans xiligouense TaxID=253184 RepID=A0A3N4YR44_9MICO|nr:hypothetical protein [Myceligenerans xiligouense]RPF22587.1 hypothetical protein EDD34_3254 [Myceligenerans xiligouense]
MTSQPHSHDDLIALLQASADRAEPLDVDARALARTAVRRGRTRRALQAGGGALAAAAIAGGAWWYGTSATTPVPADPAPTVSPAPEGRPTTGPFANDPTMERLPVLDGVKPGIVPEGWVSHEVRGLRLALPDGWGEVPVEPYPGEPIHARRYANLWAQDGTIRLAGPDGAQVIAAESALVESFSPDNPPRGYALGSESRVLFPLTGSDLAVASLQGRFYEGVALDSAEVQLRASGGRGYVVVATGLGAMDDQDMLVKLLGTLTFTEEALRSTPLTAVPLGARSDQEIPDGWQTMREGSVTLSVPGDWHVGGDAYHPPGEFVSFGRLKSPGPMTTDQAQLRFETSGAQAILVRSELAHYPWSERPVIDGQVDVRLRSGEIVTVTVALVDDEDGATLLRQIAGTVRVDP